MLRKRALDSGEEVPLRISMAKRKLRIWQGSQVHLSKPADQGSDELRPPDELPEREAAAVRAALERWRELRPCNPFSFGRLADVAARGCGWRF